MMLANYKTKKDLKNSIGQPLKYQETSMFGPEYRSTGQLFVAHRPYLQGGREWFAEVHMLNDKITKVK